MNKKVYRKKFTRDVNLAFLETIIRAEKFNISTLMQKDSLFEKDIYLVAYFHNKYVEQYLSEENSKKLLKNILNFTNEKNLKKLQSKFENLLGKLLSIKNSVNDYNEVDFIEFHKTIFELWAIYVYFLILSYSDVGAEYKETAQDIRRNNDTLFSDINKLFSKFVYAYFGSDIDARYVTLQNIFDKELDKSRYDQMKDKDFWLIDTHFEFDVSKEYIEKKYNIKIKSDTASEKVGVIKGIPASKGKVVGHVKVIMNLDDIHKISDGDVLVTSMTTPDFIPAMKRAVGFITDEGGMLSHAAIVSREFGKPCIVGTKIATQVLKNGDLVEVDGGTGVVRVIK